MLQSSSQQMIVGWSRVDMNKMVRIKIYLAIGMRIGDDLNMGKEGAGCNNKLYKCSALKWKANKFQSIDF